MGLAEIAVLFGLVADVGIGVVHPGVSLGVTVFLIPAVRVCLWRPWFYRWLVVHGVAVEGRLVDAQRVRLAEDDPDVWLQMPLQYEFTDQQGTKRRGRMAGYYDHPCLELPQETVTVLYDPRRPQRNAVYEAIAYEAVAGAAP